MKKTKKLPGSHEMRSNARKLECRQVDDNSWLVWGGENQHTIIQSGNSFECDCNSYKVNGICSHIIKVQMEMKSFPTNNNESSRY